MYFIYVIVFIFFTDKSSNENCFVCIFGISRIRSCFWPFLSLNFFKIKNYVNGILVLFNRLFVILNFRNMHLSIILATSGISRFIYIFPALVDDKENLLA